MLSLALVHRLYDYNYWARDRQLGVCFTLTQEEFLRPVRSSFSSVRDTLAHLVAVEWVWLERWKGHSPTSDEAASFDVETFPSMAVVAERWQEVEGDMRNYLAGLTPEQVLQPLEYRNVAGELWSYPLWQTLLHLVNHQTYHRGQVTTLLRMLGKTPVPLDSLVAVDSGLRE